MNEKNNWEFTQKYTIQKPKEQKGYLILEGDLNRLRGMIERIIPHKRIYQNIASISFTIFVTSIFSLISFYNVENLASWILILNWVIFCVFLVTGILSLIVDSTKKQISMVTTQNVLDEMDVIMEKYKKPIEDVIETNKVQNGKILDFATAGPIKKIVSDEKTIFTGASTSRSSPQLEPNKNAVQAKKHTNWQKADNKFPKLKDSNWIADREYITNDEATYGGQYNFTREFEIPVEKSRLESAKIYLLVDNFCELKVNGNRINRFEGFDKLHRESILTALKEGKNVVTFIITNEDFVRFNNLKHKQFFESNKKWEHNPYGFKYCIEIKYREK